eukprot:TRINITY_DN9352_c0_g2_i1.p2 TRINITY_DN9352_c0_g2~~TRINITY_DN9352_c0_g2_i1.p2  ORF type:complete len:345 (+),score=71.82 TRINITY_DN9352_c0_g2_i1:87-1037(+)
MLLQGLRALRGVPREHRDELAAVRQHLGADADRIERLGVAAFVPPDTGPPESYAQIQERRRRAATVVPELERLLGRSNELDRHISLCTVLVPTACVLTAALWLCAYLWANDTRFRAHVGGLLSSITLAKSLVVILCSALPLWWLRRRDSSMRAAQVPPRKACSAMLGNSPRGPPRTAADKLAAPQGPCRAGVYDREALASYTRKQRAHHQQAAEELAAVSAQPVPHAATEKLPQDRQAGVFDRTTYKRFEEAKRQCAAPGPPAGPRRSRGAVHPTVPAKGTEFHGRALTTEVYPRYAGPFSDEEDGGDGGGGPAAD